MRNFISFFFFVLIIACSTGPKPIDYGNDECSACKMTIMDKKFGAELISSKGQIYKFDDLICMIEFINKADLADTEWSKKLVVDYQNESNFLDAEQAIYYLGEDVHSPMNGNAAAFAIKEYAIKFQDGKQGVIMDWNQVYKKLK